MSRAPQRPVPDRLDPEKVAYWYFRLNGFLQIENFVVHPERRGSQRTDADLHGLRYGTLHPNGLALERSNNGVIGRAGAQRRERAEISEGIEDSLA